MNKKQQIHDAEYKKILKGLYEENSIITERQLVELYRVSKAPVREALVQLCSENMLKSIPRCGYQIVGITPKELEESLEIRLILEEGALKKSYPLLSKSHFLLLEENIALSRTLEKEHAVEKQWFNNMDFHLLLAGFTKNNLIKKELDRILKSCSRGAYTHYHKNWNENKSTDADSHEKIVLSLKENKRDNAILQLREDILSFRDIYGF